MNKLKNKFSKMIKRISYRYLRELFEKLYCNEVIKERFDVVLDNNIYEMFNRMYERDYCHFIKSKWIRWGGLE